MIRKRNSGETKFETFNDGVVRIYSVENIAAPPLMPKDGLTHKETLRYKERTVGLQRRFLNLQNSVEVSFLLRCPLRRNVSPQDVAIPNDGKQYKITSVQYPEDSSTPVMDLTLAEVTHKYEIT